MVSCSKKNDNREGWGGKKREEKNCGEGERKGGRGGRRKEGEGEGEEGEGRGGEGEEGERKEGEDDKSTLQELSLK